MKAVIIDDEKPAQNILKELLEKYFSDMLRIVAVCGSGEEGIRSITRQKPDIVFLDVQMPEMNGFEMLKELGFPYIDFRVVFCSTNSEHALKAFRYSATDFLAKPINFMELIEAVNKVKEGIVKDNRDEELLKYRLLNQYVTDPNLAKYDSKRVVINTLEGIHYLNSDEIIRLEAFGNYTTIHLENQKPLTVSKKIGEFDTVYPLVRVHRSRAINPRHVRKVTKGLAVHIHLSDGTVTDVARGKREEIIAYLRDFIDI